MKILGKIIAVMVELVFGFIFGVAIITIILNLINN